MATKKPAAKKTRSVIDSEKFLEMVKKGIHQNEIMKQLGIKTSTQLKVAYANALMETGTAPALQGGRGASAPAAVSKEVVVGKRGSIIIPRALVEQLGLKEGEGFTVKKSKAGLTLSKK